MGRVSKNKLDLLFFMAKRYIVFINTIRSAYSPVSLGGAALSTVKNKLALREFEKENTTTIKSPTFIDEQAVNNCFGGNGR